MEAWSVFLSFLNTMLPNCMTAETTLNIAAVTEKQGQESQQSVDSRHDIFLESWCPASFYAIQKFITTFKLETGGFIQLFYSLTNIVYFGAISKMYNLIQYKNYYINFIQLN